MKIVSMQDVSCYGQCSLTVALPICSALGLETAILPTAILSTHTSGFSGFTFRDLYEDLEKILDHWKKEGILFSAAYTGYLGNKDEVAIALRLREFIGKGPFIVDPAFGDNGKLYPGFDEAYVDAMKDLCFSADILLPNMTEACALLDIPYLENPSIEEAERVAFLLCQKGARTVVLKGLSDEEGNIGLLVCDGEAARPYFHERIKQSFHGTGDVFASTFVGIYLRGVSPYVAASKAADFTLECIRRTEGRKDHLYGVCFEECLPGLLASL